VVDLATVLVAEGEHDRIAAPLDDRVFLLELRDQAPDGGIVVVDTLGLFDVVLPRPPRATISGRTLDPAVAANKLLKLRDRLRETLQFIQDIFGER